MLRKIVSISLFFLLTKTGSAQTCSTLGQNPGTAFPVCGTNSFSQSTVPACGGANIPVPCTNSPVTDINPFWYKFTCFTSGSLGFIITPNNLADDYDWQLFDVTGHSFAEVYTNAGLFVACNWSGESGVTGASAAGTEANVCPTTTGSPYRPLFSSMPQLIQDHNYILLISHFTANSQSGYSLSFVGGTANITDPTDPHLQNARAICDGTTIGIKLNKKMKCNTLAANGSDFTINTAISNIISASGIGCANGFDMDSVVLTLNNPLPPGNYTVTINIGTDGNNLLDNCDRSIPTGESFPVTVYPLIPTPVDSLTKPGCAPDVLELVFKDRIKCNSIAADGSDFSVTGTSLITITGANGNCGTNGFTNIIQIHLSAPILLAGSYQVRLVTGTDGNTIINECGKETPPSAPLFFATKDTVSARFNYNIHFSCITDQVYYTHDGSHGVNSWQWVFDNGLQSAAKDTSINYYPTFGPRNTTLIVSNGICSDTAGNIIPLDNNLKASFESTNVVCPGDAITFKDNSVGRLVGWQWDFGNNITSLQQSPPLQFYSPAAVGDYDVPVQLIVQDDIGCTDTIVKQLKIVNNCYIAVPKGFSPNHDGLNDYLYPTNAYKARGLIFMIYDRFGQKLFETSNWLNKWDGTFKGIPQDPGTYVWVLQYTNIDSGVRVKQKGYTVLIR